jgi:hypothetical protein
MGGVGGHPEQWISHSKLEAFEQNRKPEFEEHVDAKLITVNVNQTLGTDGRAGCSPRRTIE